MSENDVAASGALPRSPRVNSRMFGPVACSAGMDASCCGVYGASRLTSDIGTPVRPLAGTL